MAFPLNASLMILAALLGVAAPAAAADVPAPVRGFLSKYCLSCHGPDAQKGDFRVDELQLSENARDAANWELVLDNLHLGEMPPKKAPLQPTIEEVEPITTWIDEELRRAKTVLEGGGGEVVMRRLNRVEYENTIADLFDVRGDFTSTFPEDALNHGFDNNGATQMLSAAQVQEYVNAAELILSRALVSADAKPETRKVTYTLHDVNRRARESADANLEMRRRKFATLTPFEQEKTHQMEARKASDPSFGYEYPVWDNGRLRPASSTDGPGVDGVLTSNGYHSATLATHRFLPIERAGFYDVRITAYPIQSRDRPLRLQVLAGAFKGNVKPRIVETIYLSDPEPRTFTHRVYLEPGERVDYTFLDGPAPVNAQDRPKLRAPLVAVRSAEIEGPILEQWPPKGYRTIFGDLDPKDLSPANVERILARLAPLLFRRPVTPDVVARYRQLFERLAATTGPNEAFRSTLVAMMVSPQFLYHVEPPDRLDGYALASRLSFFLWRSAPDAVLLEKAGSGQLENPAGLRAELDRMLADPRSDRFVRDFTGQWLRVNKLGEMRADRNLYPEYDPELEAAMREETVGFIREMFRNDLPLGNLIDSDWTMLNERLAAHYGIPGVKGAEFRRVVLDKSRVVRGGLLTQASIHAITSNGTTSSPVIRGIWVLESFLGTPPPPPPPDVPPIEPDIRGATNIRDQLKKHRDLPQCASCHSRIDPLGLALENFDVIGQWRDNYRALVPVPGRAKPQITDGPAVDASATLEGVGSFQTFPEFRKLLFQRKDLVFANVADKLATFALGRTTTFGDRDDLSAIVKSTTSRDAGLRTMVYALVESPLFRKP